MNTPPSNSPETPHSPTNEKAIEFLDRVSDYYERRAKLEDDWLRENPPGSKGWKENPARHSPGWSRWVM